MDKPTGYFVDRRGNPKGKSLGNRQRFLHRARKRAKELVDKAIREGSIADAANQDVAVPTGGIDEPKFQHDSKGGRREYVLPGNREYMPGDRINKPQGGGGGGGKRGSDSGEGEDDFQFVLSREEFLDLFFEDLELPDMVKRSLKEVKTYKPRRAGIAVTGTPTNLDLLRTMKNSFGRRLALHRPRQGDVDELLDEIEALEQTPELGAVARLNELREELDRLERRRKVVGFIDPVDLRYRHFEKEPQPNTKAVMFCLMDVSGSMGAREKDLAKRFFVLLHLFLGRRYEKVELVFIRHTHEAKEVDENTFFYSRETGGTIVSTALEEMHRVIKARYPSSEWNIYAAQASDGENHPGDNSECQRLLDEVIMPLCQYFAYIEILNEAGMNGFVSPDLGQALWRAYGKVAEKWENFAMKRIAKPSHIYPVFRELFARDGV